MTLRQGVLASVALVAALALGAATSHAARSGPTAVAANSASYTDQVGDATGGAPDISGITVTSDATGIVTFTVTTGGFGSPTDVEVNLDTDRNSATGDQDGTEVSLAAMKIGSMVVPGEVKWVNGAWTEVPMPPSFTVKIDGSVATLTAAASDLGVTTGFSFWVGTYLYDTSTGKTAGMDDAPNGSGVWAFDLNAPTKTSTVQAVYRAVIGPAVAVPARATAGKRLTVTFALSRSDNGRPLTGGTMSCTPTIDGKLVAHTDSMSNGTARLSLVVPKNAKGKTLKVKLTVTAGGSTVTKSASFHIG